jgi:hypothetical protein
MNTEKMCGNMTEEDPVDKTTSRDFSTSFLTRLSQVGNDEDDEEPVDNTQD